MRLPHLHMFSYVKTGVDFIYSDAEIERQQEAFMAGGPWIDPFAGPIVDLYRCRCGAERKYQQVRTGMTSYRSERVR